MGQIRTGRSPRRSSTSHMRTLCTFAPSDTTVTSDGIFEVMVVLGFNFGSAVGGLFLGRVAGWVIDAGCWIRVSASPTYTARSIVVTLHASRTRNRTRDEKGPTLHCPWNRTNQIRL